MRLNPEKDYLDEIVSLLAIAARTAPKAKGQDEIVIGVVSEEEKEALAKEMEKIAEEKGEKFKFFKRDAQNVRDAEKVILLALDSKKPVGVDCRVCGYDCSKIYQVTPVKGDFEGPVCGIRLIDFGIAIGSLVAKAKDLCIDNRVMYTIGVAAKRLGLISGQIVMGIPLSIKGKNIFFDRKFPK